VQENRHGEGVAHLVRVIEHELRVGERGLAFDHWRELTAAGGTAPATARWRLAAELQDDHIDLTKEVLQDLASDQNAGLLAVKAAGRLVELARNDTEREQWRAQASRLEAAAEGSATLGDVTAGTSQPEPVSAAAATATSPVAMAAAPPLEAPPSFETSTPAPFTVSERGPAASQRVDRRVLRRLHERGLVVSGEETDEVVPFEQIAAVAVAAVADGARPYLVTDLVLRPGVDGARRVLRFMSSELDPRGVLERPDLSPLDAFRSLLKLVVLEARAKVLPAASVLHDSEFVTFPSIAEYERQVLGEPA
jgi:hypothetical protein